MPLSDNTDTIIKDANSEVDIVTTGNTDTSNIEFKVNSEYEHVVPDKVVDKDTVPYEVLKLIPEESARHYKFVPLGVSDGVLEVGMVDTDNLGALDAINFITRPTAMPFKIFKISEEDFERVMNMYRGLGGDVDRALVDLDTEKAIGKDRKYNNLNAVLDLDNAGNITDNEIKEDAPAIKLVSTILRYAIEGKASDIHIEPVQSGVRIRYRVDGVLHTTVTLPLNAHRSIVARIKVLSSIRLDEKRKPQDGRFSASIDNRDIDFRVSTFPAYNGEKVVIRILDRERGFIPMKDLGLSDRNLNLLRDAIRRPHGLILISGPTGSGKSTTLYSMISELDKDSKNVLSLEDPVEYYMDGINQSQVRPEIGYTFATGLRTTLRQDPDIIMVGEIRDGETAKLAIQAALTGHLVLSTIHTNSAIGTIPRLIDMGVEPYLIPPTLIVSIAQRLVNSLCEGGGKKVPLTNSMRDMLKKQFSTLPEIYRPQIGNFVYESERTPTCPKGVRGRQAVFEVLHMSAGVEKVILKSPVESKIWEVARRDGMLTMKEDAITKAFGGVIPFTEVNLLSSLLMENEDEDKDKDKDKEYNNTENIINNNIK